MDKDCGELILVCQDIYDNAEIEIDLEEHPDYVRMVLDMRQWLRFSEALEKFD